MNRITETEQKHSFELPAFYKEILSSFDLYCLYQYKGKDLDIKNRNLLFEKLSRDYQAWQLLQYLDEPNTENTFVFGSLGDDSRLYFNLTIVSIWGIKTEQLFLFITSVLTVIGVAFFAQWSILSNITAGIIVFFSSPFKIGDTIKILDKDFPIEAKIVDIKSFYTLLKTAEGQEITLPNNLLLQKGIEIILEEEYTIKIKPN